MICERCRKKTATIHLTEIIREVKSELHLCEDCARDFGLDSRIGAFSLSIPDIVNYLGTGVEGETQESVYCHSCGTGLDDIQKTGMAGCDDCYRYLGEAISSIRARSAGGRTQYTGKIPQNARYTAESVDGDSEHICESDNLRELRKQLAVAVDEEKYEQAAVLRDLIRQQERLCGNEH